MSPLKISTMTEPMHRSMTLLTYLNNRSHHKQVVNKGAHVIVCGETYRYSYLSWSHGTVRPNNPSSF